MTVRAVRSVRGGKFDRSTTPETVAREIGALPGYLGNTPLSPSQSGALKWFARRWLHMSRDDVRGPLADLRAAYDLRGPAVLCGTPQRPVPDAMPTMPPAEMPMPITQNANVASQEDSPVTTANGQDDMPMPIANANAAPTDLLGALRTLGQFVGSPLDADAVRNIVREEIAVTPAKSTIGLLTVTVKRPNESDVTSEPMVAHEVFPELVKAVAAGVNVLLVGPAGCGKTQIAAQVATALSLSFGFTGAIASEYKLSGFKDAHGNYQCTSYRRFYENGGVYLLDEIDGSSANALLYLNAGLAIDAQDFPDAIVKRHPDFRVIASANTYGNGADRQYVGRNQLDVSSLDRFFVIPMDYDERMERALYGDNEWTNFVQKVRAATRALQMRHVVSMRAIASGHRTLAAGIDRKAVERAVIWKHLGDAEIAKVRAQMRATA